MKIERPTELPPELRKPEKKKRFPRARRWIFNGAVVLSVVLFVGNYWLWLRGAGMIVDQLSLPRIGSFQCFLESMDGHTKCQLYKWLRSEGQINVGYFSYEQVPSTPTNHISPDWRYQRVVAPQKVYVQAFEWFNYRRMNMFVVRDCWEIQIPKWFTQLLFAVLPLWWLWRWAERRVEKNLARVEASQ
jgi:hypothetical protein